MKNLYLITSLAFLTIASCKSAKVDEPTPITPTPVVPVTPSGPKITVSTFAGNNTKGYVDGNGIDARFSSPIDLVADASNNIYVSDWGNFCIRKITPAGVVSTYIGGKTNGIVNGPIATAQFSMPYGMTFDNKGNLFVGEYSVYGIRKVSFDGIVSSFATNFNAPIGMTADAAGNIYVASSGDSRIKKIAADGTTTVLAGSGIEGTADGTGVNAQFKRPCGITIDKDGNLFVADFGAHNIRKITQNGVVTTFAGTGTAGFAEGTGTAAAFNVPGALKFDAAGNLYVADSRNYRIRKITPAGVVSTLVGTTQGYTDGDAATAQFISPNALTIDSSGNIYIIDGNALIRKITITN